MEKTLQQLSVDPESATQSQLGALLNSAPADAVATFEMPKNIDRYEVRSVLGSGGFGNVYRGFDPVIRRDVAIKVPRQAAWTVQQEEAFLDEARKASLLRHPHVIMIYDAGKCAKHGVFIVMEYVSGATLSKYLSEHSISISTTARIIREAAQALHEAHGRGLIHRDIKPSNLLLDEKVGVRVADFGLALPEDRQAFEKDVISGTLPYMSPEQLRGRAHLLDGRSDIWSLGVIFYQCLAGRRPFVGNSTESVREEIFERAPRPPRQVNDQIPRRLEEICLKCLEKDVSDRYSTAGDLAEELIQWELHSSSGEKFSSEQLVDSIRRENQKWTMRTIGSVVAVLVLAGLTGMTFIRNGDSSDTTPPAADAAFVASADVVVGSVSSLETPARNENVAIRPGKGPDASPETSGAIASDVVHTVMAVTRPAGARVVAYPIVEPYGFADGNKRVEAAERTPASLKLRPGNWLVVAALDDGRFHEVYRTVPENPHVLPSGGASHLFWANRTDGTIEWPEITIPQREISAGMAEFSGAERFQMGIAGESTVPPHRRYVGSFLLDTHEMTWAEFLKHNKNQPPPSLMHLDGQLPASELPISGIWFHDAVSFAERIGKRLPTEAEYEFAATSGGTRTFPWGDDVAQMQDWPLGPAGTPEFDAVQANVPVYGLYSNIAEWTASWGSAYPPLMDYLPGLQPRIPGMWIVRGGPYSVITGDPVPAEFSFGPRQRIAQNELNLQKGLGFRCARSKQPRLSSSDLERYERD